MTALSIPDIPDDCDLSKAACAYVDAGWYVGPCLASGPKAKSPGAILGKGWQHQTTQDKDLIYAWYLGTSTSGLFGHVGRSGLVVFDVDRPENVPGWLRKYLWDEDGPLVPFQSSRTNVPHQGHYVFLMPEGRRLSNSRKNLGDTWGEVRGLNGIIVLEPTMHVKEGGRYHWVRTGVVPPLPDEIAAKMQDAGSEVDAATDDTVTMFMDTFTSARKEALMKAPIEEFQRLVDGGASRHETAVKMACWLAREASQGFYPARAGLGALWTPFNRALIGTRNRWPRSEFKAITAYAIGQALATDIDARRNETQDRLAQRDKDKQRKPANAAPPAVAADDPDKYFTDKTIGCDVQMLADDVLGLGPLASGQDGIYWSYADGVWRPEKGAVRGRCVELLGRRYRQSHASNVEDIITYRIPAIECEPLERWWNVRNGMLDWRTGELVPHSPDYHSTVQFPWNWDPDADCPMFQAFLENVLTPDYVELAWQMVAYLLYSGNPRQVAFLLYGTGDNGKGTLLRVLSQMLGLENIGVQSLSSLTADKFAAISLYGKIANLAGDMDATYQESTATFKGITGEDYIKGERKYREPFHFRSWAVPVFTVNKIPGSADTSKGYFRRWIILRFSRAIEKSEKIPGYSDRMLSEIPGIAARALPILQNLMTSSWFKDDGADIIAGIEEFQLVTDQVRQWVDEATVSAPGHDESRTSLYKSYRAWATASGVGTLKAIEFYARLESAGYEAVKRNGVRMHRGLRVVELSMIGDQWKAEDLEDPFVGADD
jgi:putative DNA primase/helicase